MWIRNAVGTIRNIVCLAAACVCLLAPVQAQMSGLPRSSCNADGITCFLPGDSILPAAVYTAGTATPLRVATLQVMRSHGGPLAHRWLQFETSHGEVTVGYGPATLPFIDLGQISILDAQGNLERIGGLHLPFVDFNYAKLPGAGDPVGTPIPLTVAQADAFLEKQRHRKFIGPYIPIFHDCHTWVCTVQASLQGKSPLPCYLLFKGYW